MMKELELLRRDIKRLLSICKQTEKILNMNIAASAEVRYEKTSASADSAEAEMSVDKMLTAKSVQALFKIAHSTYYRWVEKGWLKPRVIGGKHYYRAADIQKLIERRNYRERGGLDDMEVAD